MDWDKSKKKSLCRTAYILALHEKQHVLISLQLPPHLEDSVQSGSARFLFLPALGCYWTSFRCINSYNCNNTKGTVNNFTTVI